MIAGWPLATASRTVAAGADAGSAPKPPRQADAEVVMPTEASVGSSTRPNA